MTPEAEGPNTPPVVEPPKPVATPPPPPRPTTARDRVAALPRFSHALTPQSLVASMMVQDGEGEWIRRSEVLELL